MPHYRRCRWQTPEPVPVAQARRLSWVFVQKNQSDNPLLIRSLSIVVPAYNEQARLPETIRRIEEYLSRSEWIFHEILIVDDGSTDSTFEVASVFASQNPNVRVLRNPVIGEKATPFATA